MLELDGVVVPIDTRVFDVTFVCAVVRKCGGFVHVSLSDRAVCRGRDLSYRCIPSFPWLNERVQVEVGESGEFDWLMGRGGEEGWGCGGLLLLRKSEVVLQK